MGSGLAMRRLIAGASKGSTDVYDLSRPAGAPDLEKPSD
jgi:hypothetical protein